jgi:hypothetical protein
VQLLLLLLLCEREGGKGKGVDPFFVAGTLIDDDDDDDVRLNVAAARVVLKEGSRCTIRPLFP